MKNLLDLTVQQKNIWNTEMFYPNTDMYNIGGYIYLNDEKPDFELLEKAVNIYLEKNDISRAHFVLQNGEPKEYISEYIPTKIKISNVKDLDEAQELTEKIVHAPFNLIDSDLYRFNSFKLPDGKGGIVCLFHHLITDAWGLSLFISEVMGIYASLTRSDFTYDTNFPSYTEFMASSKEYFASEKFQKDKDFWDKTFEKYPELTFINYSNAENHSDISSKRLELKINTNLFSKITDFCKENRVSTYTFFMAIFLIYLAKVNSTNSAIIGTPVLNRTNVKEKKMAGMFISSVPFKMDIDYSLDFLSFVKNVSLNQLAIFRHQKYPYLTLLNDVKKKFDFNENLFDFVLSYQNARDNKNDIPVDYVSTWCANDNIVSSIEAHFYDMDGTHDPEIYYNYQTAKFNENDIKALHSRIMFMAEEALNNKVLKDIEVVTPSEMKEIDSFNDRSFKYNKDETLIDIFEKNVKENPDKKAVICNEKSITYKELDEMSNKVCNFLLEKGITRNDVVGVMFNRSFNIHITVLGILKAGASYLLIDPALPEKRVLFMLESSKAEFVITNLYINYNHFALDDASTYSTKLPKIKSKNEDRFCVIYTSGSTGEPKGVELKRLGVINLANIYKYDLNIDDCENCLSTATVSFDMFLAENFVPLLNGKTIILANEDEQKIPNFTAKLIKENNVDFIISTPSKIELLLLEDNVLKNVKFIQLGGEVFKPILYRELKDKTNARIYNSYGPSECTCASTNKLVTSYKNVSIGTPCINVKLLIKNHIGNVLPFNYVGEISVSGDNVGIGYMNKYKFNGSYATGDLAYLAKVDSSLELFYSGRHDNQIKLHGLRIELDEINDRILQIQGVKNSVSVIKTVNNMKSLCSYVIIKKEKKDDSPFVQTSIFDMIDSKKTNSGQKVDNSVENSNVSDDKDSLKNDTLTNKNAEILDEKKIKNELKNVLPIYMVPSHIVFVESFPITANGKVDTKKLPDIESKSDEIVLPQTETEKDLEEIWEQVLSTKNISIKTNFFDLGGDSLAAIKLASLSIDKFNINLDMKDIFEKATIEELAKLIDTRVKESSNSLSETSNLSDSINKENSSADVLINSQKVSNNIRKPIAHHEIKEFYPMTPMQKGIYYETLMDTNSVSYNTPFVISFDEMPDVKKLEYALNVVLNNHTNFRTCFVNNNGEIMQKVVPAFVFKLETLGYEDKDFVKPFDLTKAPLVHAEMNVFDGKFQLLLDVHHIICDGVSIKILIDELSKVYNGSSIKKEVFDYIDFGENLSYSKDDEKYFVDQFSKGNDFLNIPTEYERGSFRSDDGKSVFDKIENFDEINSFCKEEKITPFQFFLTCYYVLLYKYTMQNSITVGVPVNLRNNPAFYNTPGMFINTIPLKQEIASSLGFTDFANSVKENAITGFSHENYPFSELVKNLPNLHRDSSHNPIFDVMFSYESQGLPSPEFNGLVSSLTANNLTTSKFDFTLELTPIDNYYSIRLEYASKLYSKRFMFNFINCYKNIISSVLDDKDIKIADIKMFRDVPTFDNSLEFDKSERIIDLFEKIAEEKPDKTCLSFEGEHYTYKELEIKVNKLAHHIKNSKIFRDVISKEESKSIGILMNRRSEIIVSMLAILKCGCAYIPIDPSYPEDRVNYIIENSDVKMLVTEDKFMDKFENIFKVSVDDVQSFDKYTNLKSLGTSDDVAYVIYTSGSTGKPKGVQVTNKNVVNFIHSMRKMDLFNNETIISVTTISFDIFIVESLNALCNNAKIIFTSNNEQNNPISLNNLCKKNKVTAISTTPSKFNFLMSDADNLDYIKNMKFIYLSGEQLSDKLLDRIKQINPKARIFDMYGPSETTVWSTAKELTFATSVNIGQPVHNTSVYVLDNDMNPVPYNVPGKLYIGGLGVSKGYVKRDELTAERFITYNSETVYDTGDLAKFNYNNDLVCLGRDDFQVKLHGLRIELGEIENAMLSYPGVTEAVAILKNVNGRDVLCGYFVANGRISVSLLRSRIAKKLPQYMCPSFLIQLDSFTHTPNGKVDRKALPDPVIKPKEIILPKTETEKKIYSLYKNVLSIDEISVDDNFFDIGGDSLTALNLQLELMKNKINIEYGDIFKYNTIRDLAKYIDSKDEETIDKDKAKKKQKALKEFLHKDSANASLYRKRDFRLCNKALKNNSIHHKFNIKYQPPKNVLLVGATGFLGIHILAELLKIDDIKIYCLIRNDPSTSAQNKLKNKFKYYFGSDLSNLFGSRVVVYAGDITKYHFGLSWEEYTALADDTRVVINAAALVKHFGNYKTFERINVEGTKNVAYFCEEFGKTFFHTSTVSVSGNTMMSLPSSFNPKKIIEFTEKDLFINQGLDNVYVRSKFEAEKFVLEELANRKLSGIILRVGNITNRYIDGKFQDNAAENAFISRIKAFLYLKSIPENMVDNRIEFSPVDMVAKAIVATIRYYDKDISVLHIYNSNHLEVTDFVKFLNELGYELNVVPNDDFKNNFKNALFNNYTSSKVSILTNDLDSDMNLIYKTNLHVKNDFTLKYFKHTDFTWPMITKEYISKVLKNL